LNRPSVVLLQHDRADQPIALRLSKVCGGGGVFSNKPFPTILDNILVGWATSGEQLSAVLRQLRRDDDGAREPGCNPVMC
jgi:hypothetical protein